jgi:hypothetical protein
VCRGSIGVVHPDGQVEFPGCVEVEGLPGVWRLCTYAIKKVKVGRKPVLRHGGMYPVTLPARRTCPDCNVGALVAARAIGP